MEGPVTGNCHRRDISFAPWVRKSRQRRCPAFSQVYASVIFASGSESTMKRFSENSTAINRQQYLRLLGGGVVALAGCAGSGILSPTLNGHPALNPSTKASKDHSLSPEYKQICPPDGCNPVGGKPPPPHHDTGGVDPNAWDYFDQPAASDKVCAASVRSGESASVTK